MFRIALMISEAIVRCHLTTMFRLGITYDVLPRESEIIAHQFWATAFDGPGVMIAARSTRKLYW